MKLTQTFTCLQLRYSSLVGPNIGPHRQGLWLGQSANEYTDLRDSQKEILGWNWMILSSYHPPNITDSPGSVQQIKPTVNNIVLLKAYVDLRGLDTLAWEATLAKSCLAPYAIRSKFFPFMAEPFPCCLVHMTQNMKSQKAHFIWKHYKQRTNGPEPLNCVLSVYWNVV